MQPKLTFRPNFKECTKSSQYDGFVHVSTFGLIGDAFFVMSEQKLAILADRISAFYKVVIIGG